jgi:hypothetical protein
MRLVDTEKKGEMVLQFTDQEREIINKKGQFTLDTKDAKTFSEIFMNFAYQLANKTLENKNE